MWLSEIHDDTQRTFCVFKLMIKTLYSGDVLLPVVKEKSEYKDTNKLSNTSPHGQESNSPGSDCIGRCKYNYYTNVTTGAPQKFKNSRKRIKKPKKKCHNIF